MNDVPKWLAWTLAVGALLVTVILVWGGDDPPPTTTTTTGPPTTSTTTTEPPTTSTTTSSTTTTTIEPTTTTADPGDDLPAAIACRDERLPRFDFDIYNGDVGEDRWVTLQYCDELPYVEDQTGGNRYGWTAADRQGYVCEYGFAWDSHFPEEWQARVTAVQTTEGGGYARFNDRYVPDGAYTWRGDETVIGRGEIGDCPNPATEDYSPDGCLTPRPIVGIWHDDHLVDVRDFAGLNIDDNGDDRRPDVTFCLLDHTVEPFEAVGDGDQAQKQGFECPSPPDQDPGWGCVPHTIHERVVIGVVVTIDGEQVIPAVVYYDGLQPAVRFETG